MAGVRQRHPLDRAVRDVTLVPERHVLEARAEIARAATEPGRRAAPRGSGCACGAWPSSPSGRRRRAPPPRPARCGRGAGSRCTSARPWRRPTRRRRRTRRGGRARSPAWPAPASGRARRRRAPRPRDRCWSTCRPRRTASRPRWPRGRARMRRRSRSAWRAHSANLAPNVVGSACMPCVRPVTGTCSSSSARALSAATNASRSVKRRSAARVSVAHSAVSTTSDEVSP